MAARYHRIKITKVTINAVDSEILTVVFAVRFLLLILKIPKIQEHSNSSIVVSSREGEGRVGPPQTINNSSSKGEYNYSLLLSVIY